jgi:hypothetical protein
MPRQERDLNGLTGCIIEYEEVRRIGLIRKFKIASTEFLRSSDYIEFRAHSKEKLSLMLHWYQNSRVKCPAAESMHAIVGRVIPNQKSMINPRRMVGAMSAGKTVAMSAVAVATAAGATVATGGVVGAILVGGVAVYGGKMAHYKYLNHQRKRYFCRIHTRVTYSWQNEKHYGTQAINTTSASGNNKVVSLGELSNYVDAVLGVFQ